MPDDDTYRQLISLLELVADPDVVAQPRLYFNAARLDRSLVVSGPASAELARPRVARIASPAPA